MTEHYYQCGNHSHHICCDFWVDQYPFECTCGATNTRLPWFDDVERDYAERVGPHFPKEPHPDGTPS